MARTGYEEANKAQDSYYNQANQSYANAQSDLSQFRGNIVKLASGRNVGADPFKNPEYLGNEARLQSGALDSAEAGGDTAMREANRRSGGLNTGATQAGISGLALQKMRLSDALTAERGASDYGKNLTWQQFLARQPLDSAKSEEGLYGTATGGEESSLHELNAYGLQQNQAWQELKNKLIMTGVKAVAGAAGAAGGAGSIAAGAAGGANG